MTDDCFDDVVASFYRAAAGDIGWIAALTAFQRASALPESLATP